MSTPVKILIGAGVVGGTYLIVKALTCKDCGRRRAGVSTQTQIINNPWLDTPVIIAQ